jgi:hypothetical protein
MILVSSDADVSNVLKSSIILEDEKRKHEKTATQLIIVGSQLGSALETFERKFESDPSQFMYEEMDWYINSALVMANYFDRKNHIAGKVQSAKMDLILGEQ